MKRLIIIFVSSLFLLSCVAASPGVSPGIVSNQPEPVNTSTTVEVISQNGQTVFRIEDNKWGAVCWSTQEHIFCLPKTQLINH